MINQENDLDHDFLLDLQHMFTKAFGMGKIKMEERPNPMTNIKIVRSKKKEYKVGLFEQG